MGPLFFCNSRDFAGLAAALAAVTIASAPGACSAPVMPVLALFDALLEFRTFIGPGFAVRLANRRALLGRQAVHGLAPLFHGLLALLGGDLRALTRLRLVAVIRKRRCHEQRCYRCNQNSPFEMSHYSLLGGCAYLK
jgi:hypothetical protein